MKKEDELYIELNLSSIIELHIEAGYSIDRLGNIIFEDKNKVKEKINKVISDSAEELDISEDEIRNYLIKIYTAKCSNESYIQEGTEIISILQEDKELKREEKDEDIKRREEETR